ncbi:shikimate dehydrogenase [Microbulbifer donghaiensis]|uniref:Shikimate dehydrogenase (NADP(+)) n=1 Tax=Microbulbifer donghaiensis TaxID=494016 RepID=A0A1M5ASK8_9GAMM|nr:shikimate dehydrogenase [Microbulbifer donghaiensis]SHF33221.1 shikimate dehydrogenase [Microbulbifer donghaiensis]
MTDQYAVVGNPIAHSLSPQIHGAFAAQTGEDIHYGKHLVEKDRFADFAREFFSGGGRGLNVTAPFKLDACRFADQLTERARAAGAVNTLAKQGDGSVLGDNTDGAGLVADIRDNLGWEIRGNKILLLGAGGAVRGALLSILQEGPQVIHIANRTAQKAQQLAQDFSGYGRITASGLDAVPAGFDLVINASAASLSGELPPLSPRSLAQGCRTYDMVYGAEPTPFMRWAEQLGAETADGLGMLVGQAAEAFYLWRGVRPAVAPVLDMLRAELRNKRDASAK